MRIPLLLASVTAILLLATPGVQAATRCPSPKGERAVARSASTVLMTDRRRRLLACSLRSGRRRALDVRRASEAYEQVQLAGSYAAWVRAAYDSHGKHDELLMTADVWRGRKHRLLTPAWDDQAEWMISDVAVSATGAVAWTRAGQLNTILWLAQRLNDVRRIDRGFRFTAPITGPAFSATGLTWRHGDTPRSLSLPLAPSACGPAFHTGTVELDLYELHGTYSLCRRSDARNVEVHENGITAIDIDGSRALITAFDSVRALAGHLTVIDLEAMAQSANDVPGQPESPVVTTSGMAWIQHLADGIEVWVDDRNGTRKAGDVDPAAYAPLAVDGDTVRWSGTDEITLTD